MNHASFWIPWNTGARKDGDEFAREAEAYRRFWQKQGDHVQTSKIPREKPATRMYTVEFCLSNSPHQPLDVVCYFGHGTSAWIQTGHRLSTISRLSDILDSVLGPVGVVVLYACSTGQPGGFASVLASALGPGRTVWAHTTAGHTTRNPCLACYRGERGEFANKAEISRLSSALASHPTLRFELCRARSVAELMGMVST